MIMAQPFSRSNRSYRTWSGSGTAPDEGNHRQLTTGAHAYNTSLIPRKPPSSTCQHSTTASSTYATSALDYQSPHPQTPIRRSATLTRANLDRAKRLQCAMGLHQPPKYHPSTTPVSSIYSSHKPQYSEHQAVAHRWRPPEASHQIESQHYAATTLARETPLPPPSESGRSCKSGRDSVLSGFFDKVETLKRRTLWLRGSRRGHLRSASSEQSPDQQRHKSSCQLGADEIYAEGSSAIDGNISKNYVFKEDDIEEGQIRSYINEKSINQPEFRLLVTLLKNWINDELADQRIIVKDLSEDLYDGQVLGKLFEKLHRVKIDIVEVTQNSKIQLHKLKVVLGSINRVLNLQARWASVKWSAEGIYSKNLVEILHLLITLARYYRAPIELPSSVSIEQQTVQRINGQIIRRSHQILIIGSGSNNISSILEPVGEGDAFDVLFDSAPEKLIFVQKVLMRFCNRHLNKIDMTCSTLMSSASSGDETTILDPKQFSDGMLLVFLISSVENYFVPLGYLFSTCNKPSLQAYSAASGSHYASTISNLDPINDQTSLPKCSTAIQPTSYTNTQSIQMLHNVNVAFQLMEDAGLHIRQLARPEDIVSGNLKCLLRVLFALFSRYKQL